MLKALPLFLLLTGFAAAPALDQQQNAALESRSAALADRFQSELQQALKAALAAGGPTAAIDVCASIAPAIAERLSEESGALVRRTALKPRNPGAAPDAFERETMASWSSSPVDAAGKPRVRSAEAAGGLRWMRAIPTQPMCLQCHGTAIAPAVAKAITERYPGDRATGFRDGELRGALSIRWTAAPATGR